MNDNKLESNGLNRKQRIVLSVVSAFLVLLVLLGITYAYFLTRINGNTNEKSISVTTANLEIVYEDGNGEIVANSVKPGNHIGTKTFTVTNTGDSPVESYSVVVDILQNENLNVNNKPFEYGAGLVFKLTCVSSTDIEDCGNKVIYSSFPLGKSILVSNFMQYSVEGPVTHTYKLDVYFKETGVDQSDYMNINFRAKIDIKDSKSLDGYHDIGSDLLSGAILSDVRQSKNGVIYSAPSYKNTKYDNIGYNTSGANDKLLFTVLDNIGTSFVFRGAIDSNYVDFAGKCWRIVRINGDGTIRMVLEDKNQTCANSNGDWNIIASTIDDSILTGYWSQGRLRVTSKYVSDYFRQENLYDWASRAMILAFKKFQTEELSGYLTKLESGNWCLQENVFPTLSSDGNELLGLTYSQDDLYPLFSSNTTLTYSFLQRLPRNKNVSHIPQLTCDDGVILTDYKDDANNPTPMYVGALTADEIAYAGASTTDGKNNTAFYLMNEYAMNSENQLSFWTLTKGQYQSHHDMMMALNSNGLLYRNIEGQAISYRPVVNLKADTLYTSGTGTKIDPYVVE